MGRNHWKSWQLSAQTPQGRRARCGRFGSCARSALGTLLQKRLEARGLVARGAHATDRKARIVRLTPEGEKQVAKLFGGHKRAMDSAASRLSKAERVELIELLRKLGVSAEDAASTTQIAGGVDDVGTSD